MTPSLFGVAVPGGGSTPAGATTVQDIYDGVRSLLQGGQTTATLGIGNDTVQPFFQDAYSILWQAMKLAGAPRIQRDFYYTVPAYTSVVNPISIGIADFGEPELMWERGGLQSVQIARTDTSSPIGVYLASAPSWLTNNVDVTVSGVNGTYAPWGRWYAAVIDSTTVSLNGSVSDGVQGTGGTLTYSGERFDGNPVVPLVYDTDRQISTRLQTYLWKDGVFMFRGASADAQIRCTYYASQVAPTNPLALVNITDSTLFLKTMTASRLAGARGWDSMADRLEMQALGQGRDTRASGGMLYTFVQSLVQGMQRDPYRRQPFSPSGDNLYGEYPYGIFPSGGQ